MVLPGRQESNLSFCLIICTVKTEFKTENKMPSFLTHTKPENSDQASKNVVYNVPCVFVWSFILRRNKQSPKPEHRRTSKENSVNSQN